MKERQVLHGYMVVVYKAMLLKSVDREGFGALIELAAPVPSVGAGGAAIARQPGAEQKL